MKFKFGDPIEIEEQDLEIHGIRLFNNKLYIVGFDNMVGEMAEYVFNLDGTYVQSREIRESQEILDNDPRLIMYDIVEDEGELKYFLAVTLANNEMVSFVASRRGDHAEEVDVTPEYNVEFEITESKEYLNEVHKQNIPQRYIGNENLEFIRGQGDIISVIYRNYVICYNRRNPEIVYHRVRQANEIFTCTKNCVAFAKMESHKVTIIHFNRLEEAMIANKDLRKFWMNEDRIWKRVSQFLDN